MRPEKFLSARQIEHIFVAFLGGEALEDIGRRKRLPARRVHFTVVMMGALTRVAALAELECRRGRDRAEAFAPERFLQVYDAVAERLLDAAG